MKSVVDYIRPDLKTTLPELIAARVERSPNAIAYQWYEPKFRSWQSISWRELYRRSIDWSNRLLAESCLQPGDRVAIMLENGAHWVALEHAILRAGLIVVPIHPQTRFSQLKYLLNDSGCKMAFVEKGEYVQTVFNNDQFPDLERVVCFSYCENRAAEVTPFLEWLEEQTNKKAAPPALNAEELAVLTYTSGTCGQPKGVMLSHKALLSNSYSALKRIEVRADDSLFSTQSLAESLERTVTLYGSAIAGSKVIFSRTDKYLEDVAETQPSVIVSVPRFFDQLKKRICTSWQNSTALQRVLLKTVMSAVPSQYGYENKVNVRLARRLTNVATPLGLHKHVRHHLGNKIRLMISGGSRLSPAVSGFFNVLQVPLVEGYGLTEAGPIVSISPANEHWLGSVGRALDEVEYKLSDKGELYIKSPGMMLGYWNEGKLEHNAWLPTGDKFQIQEEFMFIQGRLNNELVMSNGNRVNIEVVERLIRENTSFEDFAIFEDSNGSMSIALFVDNKMEAQRLNTDALRTKFSLALRELPASINIEKVYVLPDNAKQEAGFVTTSGKVRRTELASFVAEKPTYGKVV